MVLLKKYKVYCLTETQLYTEWNTETPLDCPNDSNAIATDGRSYVEKSLPFGTIRTITNDHSPFTANGINLIINCDTSSGNITVNLPTASSRDGCSYHFRKTSASNTLTIDADGSELIDGSATATITAINDVLTITSDGTGWDSDTDIVSNKLSSITDNNDNVITGGASAAISTLVFGTEYYFAESDSVSSTTGTTYQQKLRLTTGALPFGNYKLTWSAEIQTLGAAGIGDFRIELDDTTEIGFGSLEVSISNYKSVGGVKYLSSISGIKTFDIDYKATVGIFYIRRARIEIHRIS